LAPILAVVEVVKCSVSLFKAFEQSRWICIAKLALRPSMIPACQQKPIIMYGKY